MRKYLRALFKSSFILVASSASAMAAVSPLSVAIVPPLQFPSQDFTVVGARVSAIWGRHHNVYGFDLGVIGNVTEGSFGGIGVSGIFNLTEGTTTILGLQLAGAANVNVSKARIFGLQVTAGVNSNQAESTLVGIGLAVLSNNSPFMTVYGAQVGLYNKAREVYGFQIGLVNVTESLHGIQIGLLNYNTRGLFAVAPILNIGF